MASSSAIPSASSPMQLRIKFVSSQPRICGFKRRDGSWGRVMVLWACPPCLRTCSRGVARSDRFRVRCSAACSANSSDEVGVAGKTVDGGDGGVVEATKEGGGSAVLWSDGGDGGVVKAAKEGGGSGVLWGDWADGGVVKAAKEGGGSGVLWTALSRMEGAVSARPPVVLAMKGNNGLKFAVGFFLAFAFLVIVVRQTILKREPRYSQHGSVADLVKRGQLKSHSRGISKPLRYEDPFNNPLVKVSKSNSTVEMCGTLYQLAPVTLTEKQRSSHQKRRSRAYKWKRPTIFLKEGDTLPPDVDPDTVRWIPANHPFATTVSDIDEELAQSNVFQKNGVPFRIKAEHEALQKKLEALQRDQKLNSVAINPSNIQEFDRTFKSSPGTHDGLEPRLAMDQRYDLVRDPKSGPALDPTDGNTSEERRKF